MSANSAFAEAPDAPWPAIDRRFLQGDRRAAPPFPLEVFAETWRPWIESHAQASSCTDYCAQGLLAAVSAVCGSRFVVDVTAHWREPLVLWQALVGAPSTGKTPTLVAARRLLASVTAPPDVLVAKAKKPRPGGIGTDAVAMASRDVELVRGSGCLARDVDARPGGTRPLARRVDGRSVAFRR